MTFRTARALLACLTLATLFASRAIADAPAQRPVAAAPATRAADTRPDKQQFIRLTDDGRGGGTLDTAIATYRNADGVTVHLVAAVHVAEPSYYRDLSRTFETYDALLYELVKSRERPVPGATRPAFSTTRPAARVHGAKAIGGLQGFLKDVLKLDFQLEAINYDRPNFIHADLDAETFNELQDERGESMMGLMFRSTLRQMRRQFAGQGAPPITALDIIAAMRSPDSARQYKLLLARQLSDVEGQLEGLDGDGADGTVLISERNKAALRVLGRTIGEGKRDIGIFYGAGHMRGIQEALIEHMGFKLTGVEWRVAWDMRQPEGRRQPTTTKTTASEK